MQPPPQTTSCPTEIVNITVHRSSDDLLALVPVWLELLAARGDYSFYHHPAWYLALNNTLCKDSLSCVLVTKAGAPVAILPVCEQSSAWNIVTPAHDHISMGDWVLKTDDCLNVVLSNLPEIADALKRPNWMKLILGLVPERSAVFGGLALESSPAIKSIEGKAWLYRFREIRNSYWFDTTLSSEVTALGADLPLTSKLKRNLRNRRRSLCELGNVHFSQSADQATHQAAFSDFLEIESNGWKGENGSGTAIANDDDLRMFYRSLLEIELPGWQPSINRLHLDNQVAAAQIQIKCNYNVSLLKIAFDEKLSRFSPGFLALEDCFLACLNDSNINQLSLVTCPGWARRWHPNEEPVYNLSFYNQGVRGKLKSALDGTIHKLRKSQPLGR